MRQRTRLLVVPPIRRSALRVPEAGLRNVTGRRIPVMFREVDIKEVTLLGDTATSRTLDPLAEYQRVY